MGGGVSATALSTTGRVTTFFAVTGGAFVLAHTVAGTVLLVVGGGSKCSAAGSGVGGCVGVGDKRKVVVVVAAVKEAMGGTT